MVDQLLCEAELLGNETMALRLGLSIYGRLMSFFTSLEYSGSSFKLTAAKQDSTQVRQYRLRGSSPGSRNAPAPATGLLPCSKAGSS